MSTVTAPQPLNRLPDEDIAEPRSSRGTPTWEIARFYPQQGDWTEEEYFALETNHLIEFDNGVLEFLPMPELVHQLLSGYLYATLNGFVTTRKLGAVLYAPYRVRVRTGKHREPDVLYVPKDGKLHRRYTEDAKLVIEILSEGAENRDRDLVAKRADYAAAGIPEYWIVDPETKTISVLTLDGSQYKTHREFGPGQIATSVLLEGFAVDVTDCFDAAVLDEHESERTES
jgi:Uma2 family endonuclease